jgi:hypothetical protein
MNNYRIFVLGLMAVCCIFLSGFKTVNHQTATGEEQKAVVTVKTANPVKQVSLKQLKVKKTQTSVNTTDDRIEELQKPLDLSIPFIDSENADLKIEPDTQASALPVNIFASAGRTEPHPLQVNGGLVMSAEPEAEKRKSIDGAGIVFNLKP